MMTSETRTAILLDESHKKVVGERMDEIAEIAVVKDQTPIPWCTTHDNRWFDVPGIMAGCYAGNQFKPCVDKSTGGPDHKWWKDT